MPYIFKPKKVKEEVEEMPEVEMPVEEPEMKAEDRSAYNCMDCKGEGIVGNVICARCGGTGMVA